MSRFEITPRSGSYAPLLIVALTVVVLLFFWTATRPPSPAEWALLAREAIVSGQPLPPPPSGITVRPFDGKTATCDETSSGSPSTPASGVKLVSAKLDRKDLGFGDTELIRLTRIEFPDGISSASLRWAATPDWSLRVHGPVPIILPWTMTGSEPLMIPASETEILAFIASAGGSWTSPDPFASTATPTRLVDRLHIKTFPPHFMTPSDPKESATWMGPLFRAGKLPSTAGLRLPLEVFRLPAEASLLPKAHGLLFEGIRLAVPPEISWDKDFQRSLSEIASLAFLSDVWERRAQTLATWLPALSDEIGPLLGSGFLRFNRPDLLPASATIFTPMDEITLLRAFHAARADTSPVLWYPHLAPAASAPSDPFPAIQLLSRRFSKPEDLLQFLHSHGADSFDHFLWLESGDLSLEEIPGAGFRLIACGSGSITLKGPCTARQALVISRGGAIIVSAGATRIPALMAIPGAEGHGGTIRFEHPATITEPLVAEVLELKPDSGTIVFQPEGSPEGKPLALLIHQN